MNKLHDALKNEELMLEVGRKATEEQKAMTQSTVEERLDELVRDFTKVTPISKSECRDKLNDLLQLAEQKAREEERERAIKFIKEHMYEYQLKNTFVSDDEINPLINVIINQITNSNI